MGIQAILNSKLMSKFMLRLGHYLPPRAGYAVARFLGTYLGKRTWLAPVQAVRANHWVVSGQQASGPELDRLALESYRTSARCIYDFYHYMTAPEALKTLGEFTPQCEGVYERAMSRREGTLLAMCHLASFDLVGRAAALRNMPIFAITAPEAPGGYKIANQLRREYNIEAYPASLETVRMAVERLRSGGTVATGVDRPFADSNYRPRFFGLPAALPVGHIRLALKLRLPVFALGGRLLPDGRYQLWASDPIEMQLTGDKDQDVVLNAERVLVKIEEYIHQFRTQWNMTYAVWPEVLPAVP